MESLFKPAPIKVTDIELSTKIKDLKGLSGYRAVRVLVRLFGEPIGYTTIPIKGNRCQATDLVDAIYRDHRIALSERILKTRLRHQSGRSKKSNKALLIGEREPYPVVTVAVCTRNRINDLRRCLTSIEKLTYPNLDLLVVNNAAEDPAVRSLLIEHFPRMRYFSEPRPGLDLARNKAIAEARGDVIAFTDDDVVVDPGWVSAIQRVFSNNPDVMAVTGLVTPYEIETGAQILFEMYGGFGRGFERKWYNTSTSYGWWLPFHFGAGIFGTGANMAFRKRIFKRIGDFDPALDVGTVTGGGGDLEMFFRILQEGHTLVYEPKAVVRHRHRRNYRSLKTQLTNNGIGLYSYLLRSALAYREQRPKLIQFGLWWLYKGHLQPILTNLINPDGYPLALRLAELKGCLLSFLRYPVSRRTASRINQAHKPQVEKTVRHKSMQSSPKFHGAVAIRSIDLLAPLTSINDIQSYDAAWIFVSAGSTLIGMVNAPIIGKSLCVDRLIDAIFVQLGPEIVQAFRRIPGHPDRALSISAKARTSRTEPKRLPDNTSVSVVVATYDRPKALQRCLHHLMSQETSRNLEIIVVDNHPASGITPQVTAQFPRIKTIIEARKGLAYARNAGFMAASGNIVIATDDDVVMPPYWLEKLVKPFIRKDVCAVTGNVLPLELETKAQRLFEEYGGLGRGFRSFQANIKWFNQFKTAAVPTWDLGATANAAFRRSIFNHPQIGLMDEALGPGMPSGVGEDTYLFYKIIKAGYTIAYEPSAYVWHQHRRDMQSLKSQLFSYSKGHVAYHLTTLLKDRDIRCLFQLFYRLPIFHIKRIKKSIFGKSKFPIPIILREIWGHLNGPWALYRSYRSVRRLGRSIPDQSYHKNFIGQLDKNT